MAPFGTPAPAIRRHPVRRGGPYFGPDTLGVVLTGMGEDGLQGSRSIRERGGVILAESSSSAVVYGMPRAVVEAGLVAAQAPIQEMAALISRYL